MTIKDDIALLPCPFCGGQASRKDHWSSVLFGDSAKHSSKVVYCTNDGGCSFLPKIRCKTQEEADLKWNTRATLTPPADRQAALDALDVILQVVGGNLVKQSQMDGADALCELIKIIRAALTDPAPIGNTNENEDTTQAPETPDWEQSQGSVKTQSEDRTNGKCLAQEDEKMTAPVISAVAEIRPYAEMTIFSFDFKPSRIDGEGKLNITFNYNGKLDQGVLLSELYDSIGTMFLKNAPNKIAPVAVEIEGLEEAIIDAHKYRADLENTDETSMDKVFKAARAYAALMKRGG